MTKICFVCHGNICRSPMAEFVMKELVRQAGREDEFFIVSAATHTDNIWDGGSSPIYPNALTQLKKHNIPYTKKYAALLTRADYYKYDLFPCMDDENMRHMTRIFGGDPDGKLHKLLEYAGETRDVSDPWYTRDFDRAYADILRGCKALLGKY
ncbi:MAG: low molecular weight phosphotyrosine protein phosphatase [Clostridia bacterium]|nr:low molecular weight phosphotyrosine protein phosphatase [Clostridia bacterium]